MAILVMMMGTDIPQEIIDAVVDALSEDDKAGAILLYYRASDEDLDQAWTAVQGILVDLGESAEDLPRKAADDPAYRQVNDYLTTDAATRRKTIIRFCLIALVLLSVAVYVIVLHSTRLVTSVRSFYWPSTEVTVVNARTYSERRLVQQREESTDYMDFIFRYEVDGQEYTGRRARVSYYELFGDTPFKPGDTFTIIYNPDNPAVTIYDRQIYDRVVAIIIGLICLAGGAFIAAAVWSAEYSRRRLKQLDDNLKAGSKGA